MKEISDADKKMYTIDMNKCRKNILFYGEYDYPVFTVMDTTSPYTGQTGAGIYYVETDSHFPLHGNGWYYYPVIDYCLKQNIILDSDIKYTVQASLSVPKDYFNKLIDHCYSTLPENLKKLSINSLIGSFKPNSNKNKTWRTLCIQSNAYNAYQLFVENEGCFIEKYDINEKTYYHVYNTETSNKLESEAPIYNQIVQMENIEMHKLKMIIENKGGVVLDVNTDSITFEAVKFPFKVNDDSNLDEFHFDDKKLFPKYKIEHKEQRLQIPKMAKYIRSGDFIPDIQEWKISTDEGIDKDFKPLVDRIISSNQSYNIDGRAGVGKSHLIKEIQKQLTTLNKSFASVAPTNKASRIIDGQTLNKFVCNLKTRKGMNNMDLEYLLVDEISMVKEVFYKFLIVLKKSKPNLKVLCCGDFEQLLPVNDRVLYDYKESRALQEICDGNRLCLLQCRRSDNKMYELCKHVNRIKKTDFTNNLSDRNLTFTNAKRILINDTIMTKEAEKTHSKKIKLDALCYDPNSQDVTLFPGVPIIAKMSNKTLEISNNETFKIKKVSDVITIVDENKKEIIIELNDFQRLFYVAYAITIHRCQGETYNRPYTIHEWERLDKRLKYVALSRTTKKEFINII